MKLLKRGWIGSANPGAESGYSAPVTLFPLPKIWGRYSIWIERARNRRPGNGTWFPDELGARRNSGLFGLFDLRDTRRMANSGDELLDLPGWVEQGYAEPLGRRAVIMHREGVERQVILGKLRPQLKPLHASILPRRQMPRQPGCCQGRGTAPLYVTRQPGTLYMCTVMLGAPTPVRPGPCKRAETRHSPRFPGWAVGG